MATAVLYAALNPRAQILVFFVLPVNVVLGVGALVLWDLAHLGERAQAGRASVDRAAHLAGAVSATTVKPVIGVPMNASLDGLDALLSTVQMPAGIPVASVAIGKAGAKNAAYLAAQILGVTDGELGQKLRDERAANAEAIYAKDAALQESLKG